MSDKEEIQVLVSDELGAGFLFGVEEDLKVYRDTLDEVAASIEENRSKGDSPYFKNMASMQEYIKILEDVVLASRECIVDVIKDLEENRNA